MNSKKRALFYISVKAVIRDKHNRFLILKSLSKSKYFCGKYDLPGGTINFDEINTDFHKIIRREIREECGPIKYKLRFDPVSLSKYRYSFEHERLYILFEARHLVGQVKISDEHTEFKWIKLTPKNIKKLFHPALRQLLNNYVKWNKIKL